MNLWILLSVIVPALGVVIAVYQQILSERRRLHSAVDTCHTINDPTTLKNATIIIKHNGVEYSDHIYFCNLFFKNIGNRDISARDFQHPVRITLPDHFTLVDFQVDDRFKSKVSVESHDNLIDLKWGILKPREKIDVSLVLTSAEKIELDLVEKSIVIDDRLINVTSTKQSSYRLYAFAGLASILSLSFMMLFNYIVIGIGKPSEYPVGYEILGTPHAFVLINRDGDLSACEISKELIIFQRCQNIENINKDKIVIFEPKEKGHIGLPNAVVWMLIISFILYALPPFYFVYKYKRRQRRRVTHR